MDRHRRIEALESALGHRFRDPELLEAALRHASFAHEQPELASNERLEFLGDAVIGLVVAHRLYAAHPDWKEGELTRALHNLVDKRALAELARGFGLGEILELGRTEQQSEGGRKTNILGDAMEAVIGALYLDGGLEPVRALSERAFAEAFAPGAPRVRRDPKTELQELVMAERGALPSYRLERDSGIEGDEARFTVEVWIGSGHDRAADRAGLAASGGPAGRGVGRSKRLAERAAAAAALAALGARDAQREDEGDPDVE